MSVTFFSQRNHVFPVQCLKVDFLPLLLVLFQLQLVLLLHVLDVPFLQLFLDEYVLVSLIILLHYHRHLNLHRRRHHYQSQTKKMFNIEIILEPDQLPFITCHYSHHYHFLDHYPLYLISIAFQPLPLIFVFLHCLLPRFVESIVKKKHHLLFLHNILVLLFSILLIIVLYHQFHLQCLDQVV